MFEIILTNYEFVNKNNNKILDDMDNLKNSDTLKNVLNTSRNSNLEENSFSSPLMNYKSSS